MTDLREEPLTLFDTSLVLECVTVPRADLKRVLAAYHPVTAGDEAALARLLDITEPGWADA
jgi:hypothetical protein